MKTLIFQLFPNGSYGDDAMAISLIEQKKTKSDVLLITGFGLPEDFECTDFNHQKAFSRLHRFYSPNMVLKRIMKMTKKFVKTDNDIDLFFIGADVIDGYYGTYIPKIILNLMTEYDKLGIKSTLVGSSFSAKGDIEIANKLASVSRLKQCRICIRDVYSLERLNNIAAGNYELVADVATLLKKSETEKSLQTFIQKFDLRIALNFGSDINHQVSSTQEIANLIKNWYEKKNLNVIFVGVGHDTRGPNNGDFGTLREIKKILEAHDIPMIVPNIIGPKSAKSIASQMDIVITRRMHLAVAALSQGVKTIGIDYANKFEGQFLHYSQQDCVVYNFYEVFELLDNIIENQLYRFQNQYVEHAKTKALLNLG